jgi:hypothetical protein
MRELERKRQADRKYYQTHKEKRKAYHKQWVRQNPEKVREIKKRYREQHRDRLKEKAREAMKKKVWFNGKQINLGFNPRKGICEVCGATNRRTEIHHFNYDSDDPLENTIELCHFCHSNLHYILRYPRLIWLVSHVHVGDNREKLKEKSESNEPPMLVAGRLQ